MKRNIFVAAVGVAVASMLAACAPSYVMLGTQIQVTAQGKVNLSSYGANGFGASGTRTVAGPNNTADANISASLDGGNWVINGTWKDGFVKFRFKGINPLGYGVLSAPQAAFASAVTAATQSASEASHSGSWVTGGCMPIITNYESTNPATPGTGAAIIVVCDQGLGSGIANTPWTDPDYIAVFIPNTRDIGPYSDNSPFVFYESGGFLTGRGSSAAVKARELWTSPTATQDPSWTPVSSTSSSAPLV
jgi:hypothetical protein